MTHDLNQIARAIELLYQSGDVFECRALEVERGNGYTANYSGFFELTGSNAAAIAREIAQLPPAMGVYVTLNPVDPALLGRACHRMKKVATGEAAGDADSLRRRWILVDIDPVRPARTSATDAQRQAAQATTVKVFEFLSQAGWPQPLLADSGNGYHLLYRIDLPTKDGGLIKACLEALALRFDTPTATIDTAVFNPARICRLYGTIARKGDEVLNRGVFHRCSRILQLPSTSRVALAQLEALAALRPQPSKPSVGMGTTQGEDWFTDWCARYEPGLIIAQPDRVGVDYDLWKRPCPWNAHHGNDAYLLKFKNGAIAAGCHHASCQGQDWEAYRKAKEPDYAPQLLVALPHPGAAPEWLSPLPIPGTAHQAYLPPLEVDLLPPVVRPFIWDVAERMQCPTEYVMTALLIVVAAVIGRKLGIYPKAADDWLVIVNLWGAIVGDPGILKSPTASEVMRPARRLDSTAKAQFEQALHLHEKSIAALEAQKKSLAKTAKPPATAAPPPSAAPAPLSLGQLDAQLDALRANAPKQRRIIIQDATMEKIPVLLADNPNGLLVFWDELSGLLRSFEQKGHEQYRPFFLESWAGTNPYTVDRVGREHIWLDAVCLSILGTIQPDPLLKFARQSFEGYNDGLIQRFQIILFPSAQTAWRYVDRPPDYAARDTVDGIIQYLYHWDPSHHDLTEGFRTDKDGQIGVGFGTEAQELFKDWLMDLMNNLSVPALGSTPMVEHCSKFRSLMPSLSLIFHCLEGAAAESIAPCVSLENTALAAAFCEHLTFHARHLYALCQPAHITANVSHELLGKIAAGQLTSGMTINAIVRKNWRGLKDRDAVRSALEVLEAAHWLRLVPQGAGPAGGQPTDKVELNPQALSSLRQRPLKDWMQPAAENATPPARPWLDRLRQLRQPPPDTVATHSGVRFALITARYDTVLDGEDDDLPSLDAWLPAAARKAA